MLGAASAFNLSGRFYEYNSSPSAMIADSRAIGNDFSMVGQDIVDAVNQLGVELKFEQMELNFNG